MPKSLAPLLTFLLPVAAFAGEPPCAPPVATKTVTQRQVLLVPHEQAITVPDGKLREVEAGRAPAGPVLDFVEQKSIVTEMELRESEVEQTVVCQESRPVTVTDPVTGKTCTHYQSCPVARVVKVKVYCPVPVPREVVVRVPVLRPGPDLIVKKLVLDTTTVPAVKRSFTATQTVNPIPVVLPPLPCCRPD